MDYSQLKQIVSVDSFNIIHNLINRPKMTIYMVSYANVDSDIDDYDPYATEEVDMTSITESQMTLVGEFDCIYAYDRTLISDSNSDIGTTYSLTVYVRYDDLPDGILQNDDALIINLKGVEYKVKNTSDAYGIIVTFELSR